MARFSIEKAGDTYEIAGPLDEQADFAPLLAASAETPAGVPLKLSFEGVTSLSAEGATLLSRCLRDLGTREVELHLVPTFLVEEINVVPGLIGRRVKNLVSLFAPYHCATCRVTEESLIERREVRQTHRGTEAPQRRCERCGGQMKLKREEEDLFLFLTYSA